MRRIGIIAGNGTFALEYSQEVKKHNHYLAAVCHSEETDKNIDKIADKTIWVKVGQLSKIIKFFKDNNISEAVMLGGITRVRLFQNFLPDFRTIAVLAKAKSLKDDGVLTAIAAEIEKEGIKVIAPSEFLLQSLATEGVISKSLTDYEKSNASIGFAAAIALGSIDCGQTAVTCGGTIIALECIEGTDATIKRAGEVAAINSLKSKNEGGIVVKVSKPNQDLRFDLPAVGVKTLEIMKESACTALVLQHERAFIQDPEAFRRRAVELGIAVEVWKR